jgi:hypothetical protein
MALTQLAPPYPIFTDKSGSPLDAGYLYFGEVNKNPETNPIQVFYDSAFTQPAAQPLRTSNGYVMRNGSPALIYAGSQFSVTVRDKNNALVIYSPVGFGVVPFAPVTFATSDRNVRDVSTLLADTQFTYTSGVPNTVQVFPGDILRTLAEGFAYEVAASGATDEHLTTAGGVKLYVIPNGTGSAQQWGVNPNAGVDVYTSLQLALDNQDEVVLEEGVYLITRGLRQTRNGSHLRGVGPEKTIIRAVSPTANNIFGGTNGSEAVVWALGGEGDPLYSIKCEDVTLDCAGLLTGPSILVGLKGKHYAKVLDFEVNRVEVTDCASYAFWANDKTVEAGGVITGSSGVYNFCRAYDAQIAFEAVGKCALEYNFCEALQTRSSWAWSILEQFHPYGIGDDSSIVYNFCKGIADCGTLIGPLLSCKNVTFNGGYYEQLNAGTTVINMGASAGSDYDNWVFDNVTMIGTGVVGALSFGALNDVDARMVIVGGLYEAKEGTGLTFTAVTSGNGIVEMHGSHCKSTTSGGAVPFSLITANDFKSFKVFGGVQEAFGPSVGSSAVNAATASFTNTKIVPPSGTLEKIRQDVRGSAVFLDGGGFAQINFGLPINVADKTKVVVTGAVEASATSPTGAGEGVAYTWNNPSANIINILAPSAAIGRTFNYYVVEFE